MSLRDTAALILRQIPSLMATAGLQYRIVTSMAGVEPKAFAGGWVSLVGQLEEHARTQSTGIDTRASTRQRIAHVTVSDALDLPEGSEVSIGGAQPHWTVSGRLDAHRVRSGIVTYVLVRDEPLSLGPDRGGAR